MSRRRDGDLTGLSMPELLALRDRVEAEIESRRSHDDLALRSRGGMIERDGPRYVNPANSAETWSGRGRQPAWVERALAGGLTLEELEVLDDRPVHGPDGS